MRLVKSLPVAKNFSRHVESCGEMPETEAMALHGIPKSAVVVVTAMATAGAALAQYDRNGRYVPSPMGVPADPYARVVPNYSGTPGRVTGTPVTPPPPAPLTVPPLTTQRLDPTAGTYSAPLVPLTAEQCRQGWSVETNIPRVEFNRRCSRMRAKAPAE